MKRLIVIIALGIMGSCSAVHLMPARRESEAFSRCMKGTRCYAPFCVHKVAKHVLKENALQEEAVIRETFNRAQVVRPSISASFRQGPSSLNFAKLQNARGVVHSSGNISRTGWSDIVDRGADEFKKGLMGDALERVTGRICPGMSGAAARAFIKNRYKK